MTKPIKVLLLTKYSRIGASSRLRTLQYLPFLETEGLSIRAQGLFDDKYLEELYTKRRHNPARIFFLYARRAIELLDVFSYDLIWIEKEIFPYLPPFAERMLVAFGLKYIVDYDDAVFHNYDLSSNPIIRTLLGRKIDAVMHHSSCVIAGNRYLADRAKGAGSRRIEIIPTVVDPSRYAPRNDYLCKRPVIGWIGSPSTQKYVLDIFPALLDACRKHRARLLLVGASPQVATDLPGIDVEVLPWSEAREAEFIAKMDVGIMPLSDGPWERGKCGYKLIQYMASAIPVIASPVGVNVEILKESKSGFLANDLDAWREALTRVLSCSDLRKTMGLAGRQSVEKEYSIDVQSHLLKKIIAAIKNLED